jgi:hypothetical protein
MVCFQSPKEPSIDRYQFYWSYTSPRFLSTRNPLFLFSGANLKKYLNFLDLDAKWEECTNVDIRLLGLFILQVFFFNPKVFGCLGSVNMTIMSLDYNIIKLNCSSYFWWLLPKTSLYEGAWQPTWHYTNLGNLSD